MAQAVKKAKKSVESIKAAMKRLDGGRLTEQDQARLRKQGASPTKAKSTVGQQAKALAAQARRRPGRAPRLFGTRIGVSKRSTRK